MAKVRGPLLSISARGQIGKSQVYAGWRGVPYARQYVQPANPRSAAQVTTRSTFSGIDAQWKRMFTLSQAPWDAASKGRPFTGRNKLISDNLPALRGDATMADWIGSPGNGGGLPPTSVTAASTATAGELDVTVGVGQVPLGWTADAVVAHVFLDRDPATDPTDFVSEQELLAPVVEADNVLTFTGLDSAVPYVAAAWIRWIRPDGTIAYGPSISQIGTPT